MLHCNVWLKKYFIDVLKIRKSCCLEVKKFIVISKFSLLNHETEICYLKFEGYYDASLSLFYRRLTKDIMDYHPAVALFMDVQENWPSCVCMCLLRFQADQDKE